MENIWGLGLMGGAFGIITALWGRIKEFFWRIVNLFIVQVEITSEQGHSALIAHLIANYQRSRIYDRNYAAWHEHQRDGRYGLVPCEVFGSRTVIFWKGWVPFLFSNAIEAKARTAGNKEGAGDSGATKVHSTVTFVRGTMNVEALFKAACDATNALSWDVENKEKKAQNRFVIHFFPNRQTENQDWNSSSNGLAWYQQGMYRLLSHSPDQLGKAPLHNGNAIDNLIFPARIKNLIKEIELWRNHRQWYLEKGIPWKRGWLLYGPPGTGKTALARAFAEDLNMPIYVFNLAEMSNGELMKAWSEMQVNVPCIALIEDVDNVFHGRENVARKGMMSLMMGGGQKKKDEEGSSGASANPFSPLTFDCLLNCLDGVERSDGIFTIITTNDIAKVDPALGQPRKLPDGSVEFISTRPGRIDKAVELTYMELANKKMMAKRILGEYPDQYMEMLEFIDKFTDMPETPAQFQERCGQIALQCFWKDKQEELALKNAKSLNGVPASGATVNGLDKTVEIHSEKMNGKAMSGASAS